MSLIITYTNDTAGHQAELKDRIKMTLSMGINNAKQQILSNYNLIWHNANLTPTQAFAALGTDAVQLLTISTALKNLIVAVDPNYVPLVPLQTLTPNVDGTVTVS